MRDQVKWSGVAARLASLVADLLQALKMSMLLQLRMQGGKIGKDLFGSRFTTCRSPNNACSTCRSSHCSPSGHTIPAAAARLRYS